MLFIFSMILRGISLYSILIVAYALMTWFPQAQGTRLFEVLSMFCRPYLEFFERYIPSFGGVNVSPMVALLVLQMVSRLLARIFFSVW